jgi:hypothetical protein
VKKSWWWKWTVERPAAFGNWLWLVLVVLPAEYLDRLTWRKALALIPLAIFAIAVAHNIPLPPEILLLGDTLAYLDLWTMVILLAATGRAGAILYLVRQIVGNVARLAARTLTPIIRQIDFRHRRARKALGRKRLRGIFKRPDEDCDPFCWGVPA